MKLNINTSPLEYAQSLPTKDLKKLIRDCKKGEYDEFTDRCRICLEHYLAGNLEQAEWWNNHAERAR